ncbi:MAG: hypothetical protein J6X61_04625, partial [Clostridia bacterium]|nr:hypothetical protein [Clostridia bacterium]
IVSCKPGTGAAGMPSKTWTIMATGTAVLGSFDTNSEMDRILRQADCGLCVPAGDAAALADAIRDLSRQPDRVQTMGKHARLYAVEHAGREPAVRQYIDIIEETVGR